MDTLVGGTRWEYPLGPGNPPAVQAEYLPLRDHLGSTVMLMRAEYTTDLGQFYGVFAEPEPPPGGQSLIEPENAGFGLKVAETFDYDPYGWPTVHAPFGSPAKFGDPVVGLLAIRSGQVGALEGSLTNSPLLSGRELWQWYTNEPGNDPMLVESETTRAPHASTGWRHLYTGRPWDSQTRSYYYRHRWYDPHQARFLSRDPIGYAAGLLQYAYVGGDPIGRVDPTGLVLRKILTIWIGPRPFPPGAGAANPVGGTLCSIPHQVGQWIFGEATAFNEATAYRDSCGRFVQTRAFWLRTPVGGAGAGMFAAALGALGIGTMIYLDSRAEQAHSEADETTNEVEEANWRECHAKCIGLAATGQEYSACMLRCAGATSVGVRDSVWERLHQVVSGSKSRSPLAPHFFSLGVTE